MMIPSIHMNGTSREALYEQWEQASAALRGALDALARMAPNGRDYYPQGPHAYQAAAGEHEDRMARVRTVLDEVEAIWLAVDSAAIREASMTRKGGA